MSSIGIKTLSLVSSNPGVTLQEGVSINGKPHKLLKIKLGFEAHMEIEVFFTSIMATTEIRNKAKWIWAIQDDTTKEWTLNGWTDPKDIPIEINGKETTQYADSPRVLITTSEEHSLGNLYWLEAFVHYPEMPNASIPKGVYVTFEDSPMLKKACFSDKGFCNFTAKELQYIPVAQYGKTINLFLSTYKLPDPNLRHHNYGSFKVTIFSKKTGKAVQDEIIYQQEAEGVDSFLGTTKLSLLVSEEWRAKVNHKEKTEEEFYAEITPIFNENKNATLASKGFPRRPMMGLNRERFEPTEAPNDDDVLISYYQPKRLTLWSSFTAARVNSKQTDYEETELDTDNSINTFKVIYNTGEEILLERANKVGEQMATIADTNHECIPNAYECKYTSIKLTEPDRSEPIIILEENDQSEVKDLTATAVEIISGDDKKKDVKIILGDLTYAETPVECLKIGRYHETAEDVFGMNEALMHLQWLKKEDVIVKENELTLKLKYNYNESYESQILDFLALKTGFLKGGILELKNIWVIKYLIKIAKGESLAQNYFVPISTCRYPYQKVLIDVYPDMKWIINVNYNIQTPIYYKSTSALNNFYAKHSALDGNSTSNSRKRKGNIDGNITNALMGDVGQKSSFEVGIECELSGRSPLNLNTEFAEKIRGILAPILWIHDKLNSDIGVSNAKKENNRLKASGRSGLLKRLSRAPMSFTLVSPKIGFGVGIGYGETEGFKIGYELEGRLIMNPIIGADIKLDVLALGSKFKPWGAIIDALDIVSWAVGFCSGGKAELDYKIDIIFSAEVKLLGTGSSDGSTTPADIHYNFLSKRFGGNVAIQGKLTGKIEASIEMKYLVEEESNKKFKQVKPNKKKAFELGVGIEAESYVTLTLGKNWGVKDDFSADFYFSGVTMKVWVKAGFAKPGDKPKLVNLVPDVDKSFNILKNKGEYK